MNILIKNIILYIKRIIDSNRRFRFRANVENGHNQINPDKAGIIQNQQTLPEPSKLVTAPHNPDDPLDPFKYIRLAANGNGMDTATSPPELRKPPKQNAEYFFSWGWGTPPTLHIKKRRNEGYGLCGCQTLYSEHGSPKWDEIICKDCLNIQQQLEQQKLIDVYEKSYFTVWIEKERNQ